MTPNPLKKKPKFWVLVTKGKKSISREELRGRYIEADRVDTMRRLQSGTIAESEKTWLNVAVGYFMGKNIDLGRISAKAKEIWGEFGLVGVRAHSDGFFFFSFATNDGMEKILEFKQWRMFNNPVCLK